MNENDATSSKSRVSHAVFIIAIITLVLYLIPVIFPALLIRLTSSYESFIDPYDFGIQTFPFLATELILLMLVVLHRRKALPNLVTRSIDFVYHFEISRKVALVVLISLIAIFAAITIGDMIHPKELIWPDYTQTETGAAGFDLKHFSTTYVRYLLLSFSLNTLGDIRILPYLASISLLVLTYFVTVAITKKRFAGVVSVVILLQSSTFLEYSTTATYENFWTDFYLLSLYMIYRRWYLSPVFSVLSFLSKQLTAIFLPMTFFFIYRAEIPRRTKVMVASANVAITIIIAVIIIFRPQDLGSFGIKHPTELWIGFSEMENFLRNDYLVVAFILPLIVALYLKSRKGILIAESIIVFIIGMLLSNAALNVLTQFKTEPYRFVPIVVFFAIGVGVLLTKVKQKV